MLVIKQLMAAIDFHSMEKQNSQIESWVKDDRIWIF